MITCKRVTNLVELKQGDIVIKNMIPMLGVPGYTDEYSVELFLGYVTSSLQEFQYEAKFPQIPITSVKQCIHDFSKVTCVFYRLFSIHRFDNTFVGVSELYKKIDNLVLHKNEIKKENLNISTYDARNNDFFSASDTFKYSCCEVTLAKGKTLNANIILETLKNEVAPYRLVDKKAFCDIIMQGAQNQNNKIKMQCETVLEHHKIPNNAANVQLGTLVYSKTETGKIRLYVCLGRDIKTKEPLFMHLSYKDYADDLYYYDILLNLRQYNMYCGLVYGNFWLTALNFDSKLYTYQENMCITDIKLDALLKKNISNMPKSKEQYYNGINVSLDTDFNNLDTKTREKLHNRLGW